MAMLLKKITRNIFLHRIEKNSTFAATFSVLLKTDGTYETKR